MQKVTADVRLTLAGKDLIQLTKSLCINMGIQAQAQEITELKLYSRYSNYLQQGMLLSVSTRSKLKHIFVHLQGSQRHAGALRKRPFARAWPIHKWLDKIKRAAVSLIYTCRLLQCCMQHALWHRAELMDFRQSGGHDHGASSCPLHPRAQQSR